MSWPTQRPERLSPLHNFSLPPSLKWGAQKVLRCMKSSSARRSSADDSSSNKPGSRSASASAADADANADIEDVREKLMRDLRMAGKRMMLRSPVEEKEEEREESLDESVGTRPWNLRMRRAACRAPGDCVGGGERNCDSSLSPMRQEKGIRKIRNLDKSERAKFSIGLSKEEVELDYLVMVGRRPPRRSKKRPRILQKQLDLVFPGSWLTEITIDRYKVPDFQEPAKL